MTEKPQIAIIQLIGKPRQRAERALASVLAQESLEAAEILLVDSVAPAYPPLPGSEHPQVKVIQPTNPAHFGAMKAEAVRQAKADLVVFVEDHVEADPGWLKAILAACEGPWSAVGCQVLNANPEIGISKAIGLVNYGLWTPPVSTGETDLLPGNNTAYRRDVLLQLGDELADLLTADTVLQWRILADGHRLFLESAARIRHLNPTSLGNCLRAEFYYHWPFAGVRSAIEGWSFWRRLRYVLLSPAIPWLRLRRALRLNAAKHMIRRADLTRRIPQLILIFHAAVAGQLVGLLLGPRRGIELFTVFELNSPRPTEEA